MALYSHYRLNAAHLTDRHILVHEHVWFYHQHDHAHGFVLVCGLAD